MPARSPALVLGFMGAGEAPARSIDAILTDYVKAKGPNAKVVLPATESLWSDAISAAADVARNNGWGIEVVIDDTSAKFKPVKSILSEASRQHKATDVPNTVAGLATGALMVFFDDTDETHAALAAASEAGVPLYDLCDGMQEITLTNPEPKEDEPVVRATPAAEPEAMSMEWLEAKTEDELQGIADDLGINCEEFDTWDEVRTAIFEHDTSGVGDQGGGDVDNPWPAAADLEDWGFDDLKAFATENQIEVPANSRSAGYRKAIEAFLEQVEAQTESLEGDVSSDLTGSQVRALMEDLLDERFAKVEKLIATLDRSVVDGFTGIRESLQNGTRTASAPSGGPGRSTPGTTVKKAAPATKATAKRAVAAKKAGGTAPRTAGRR